MSWYCDVAPGDEVHRPYHDEEYGFPCTDERALCERLALEIFQAGLSWRLILSRRLGLRAALEDFVPDRLARLTEAEVGRLLGDRRIIRNPRKLAAVIANAQAIVGLRASHGGFAAWLAAHHPRGENEWLAVFKKTFRFMGPEVVREFLVSVGYLPGAHRPECPVYERIVAAAPPWLRAPSVL